MLKNKTADIIVLFSPLAIPLLQTIIWLLGTSINDDLYHQFDEPLFHEEGPAFALMVFGFAQCFVAIVLGSVASIAFTFRPHVRRVIHLVQGSLGAVLFGWCLAKQWNFESNHATSELPVTSPFVFDFERCVFFGLPLLWCLSLIFFVVFVRTSPNSRPSN